MSRHSPGKRCFLFHRQTATALTDRATARIPERVSLPFRLKSTRGAAFPPDKSQKVQMSPEDSDSPGDMIYSIPRPSSILRVVTGSTHFSSR